jgi:hypothetical protein
VLTVVALPAGRQVGWVKSKYLFAFGRRLRARCSERSTSAYERATPLYAVVAQLAEQLHGKE